MKYITTLLIALPLLLSAEEDGNWTTLFNGKNLDGWTQRGGVAKYEVVDGVIVGFEKQDQMDDIAERIKRLA